MMMGILTNGFIFAQRALETTYPTIEGIKPETTAMGLPEYVKYVFNFSLGAAGLIVFIVFFSAGVRYLTSAGNPTVQRDARKSILAAFLGLIVLLFSYLILTTINPQLIVLTLPERTIFSGASITPPPAVESRLYYTEIPIGGLIGELLAEKRWERIASTSENIKKISEDLFKKSQELYSLDSQCTCSNTSPSCSPPPSEGWEGVSSSGYNISLSVNSAIASGEWCSGSSCSGDPCPARNNINQKREQIQELLSEENNRGLPYWQKELDIEINSLRKIYEDLKSAEDLIKDCQGVGPNGGLRSLSDYNDFMEYLDRLGDVDPTRIFVPDFPFGYVSSTNPYYLATFYCYEKSEPYLQIVPEEVQVQLEEVSGEQFSSQTMYCGDEIHIGEAIDNTEEVVRQMLTELDSINSNVLGGVETAHRLIDLSDPVNCVISNCHTNCVWVHRTCCSSCGSKKKPKTCCSDCSYCNIPPCSGSLCPGDPALIGQIATLFTGIKNNNSQVIASYKKIDDLIEERITGENLKKSKVLENLNFAKMEMGECYTPKNRYAQLERGEEVNLESLLSCSGLKQSLEINLSFYDEAGNKIEQCYGSAAAGSDLMDNFFCCFSNISF